MSEPSRVTLFLCGDVMTGRGIDQILPDPCAPEIREQVMTSAADYVALAERANGPIPRKADPAYVWGEALDELRRVAPAARIVNLETSVTRSNDRWPKGINYRMSPENAACLQAAGIDCCALANNHVLDWGRGGLDETLSTLARLGIKTAGAGRTSVEARAPAILDLGGDRRVLVWSCAVASSGIPCEWRAGRARPGINLLGDLSDRTVEAVAQDVAKVRRPGDIVVISIHWGANWGYDVTPDQRRFAHGLIERAGASVVHGHSSHHPKAIEMHRGRLILYGCGDFLDDYEGIRGYEAYRSDLALMYFATVGADGVELEMTPLRIRRFRLNRCTAEETRWLHEALDREARAFGGRIELTAEGRLRFAARS